MSCLAIADSPTAVSYDEFLSRKRVVEHDRGFRVKDAALNKHLYPFQRHITKWALKRGAAAIFADCGLGKSLMELDWAQHVSWHTGKPSLILTPLAVAPQFVEEGQKFGIPVTLCRKQKDVKHGVNVTNYDMLDHFDPAQFGGVVLDESSILKCFTGATKQALCEAFARTPYRLCGTATPSPNDLLELGNHADFLGIMPSSEMLMRWFINDTMEAGGYRLKKHAAKDYWRWVCSWAVAINAPSDLGYSDEGFILPDLQIIPSIVEVDIEEDAGEALFRHAKLSATNMHTEMRRTCNARAKRVAEIMQTDPGQWVIWCNTNYEQDALESAVGPDFVSIRGSETGDSKTDKAARWKRGEARTLISKPSIFGWGQNWQHCHNSAFVGLSYSFELFYQAVRRLWRYGQTRPVNAYMVHADTEGDVFMAVQEKQSQHVAMKDAMIEAVREFQDEEQGTRGLTEVLNSEEEGRGWKMILGDACREVAKLPENSVHFSIYSPPFSNLYVYSDSLADMGNSEDDAEFMEHYRFLLRDLLKVTIPGRLMAIHCKDLPLYKGRDGAAGLRDFPGEILRVCAEEGWTYHSRITIWKDPVIEMQRTKNHGLLYKELCKDSSCSRQGMADYVIVLRKWDDDELKVPVKDGAERFKVGDYIGWDPPVTFDSQRDYSIQVWQRYASPVWFDIRQTNVLNIQMARDNADEKHICPLQLDVIERAVQLWTNPGETVLSPFAGVGSEGYVSVKMGRQFIGVELKPSYFDVACRNLHEAEVEAGQQLLFAS
jgi:hypothetical protein